MAARCQIPFLLVVLLATGWAAPGQAASPAPDCQRETAALASMSSVTLRVYDAAGDERWVTTARVARTSAQRAAGMQHLCPQVVAENPMVFVFPRPSRPRFHMSNVFVALDILFLDEDRRIVEIAHMPVGPQLVGPSVPIHYALELVEGEAAARELRVGDRVDWN